MAKVLVTGASGFIGGHLAEALAQRGEDVRCLVRQSSQVGHLEKLGVQTVRGDLTEPSSLQSAVAGMDVVFHLAAATCALRRAEMMRVNAEGVAHLARACASQETPPVHVLVSSVAAAGPTARGRLRDESDPPSPVSNYGRSKRIGELAAEAWAHAVPTTIVRPGMVFGRRNRELLPVFQCIHRLRIHLVVTFDPPPLSLIDVDDLVEILLRAAERGERIPRAASGPARSGQGVYFACAPEHPDYAQLGRLMAYALGHDHVLVLPVAEPIPWLIGGLNQLINRVRGRADHLNVDKMREATADSWACSTRAVQERLGYQTPKSLADQFREVVGWYREYDWL